MTAGSMVREIILKTHSRCNLACSYCYVYFAEDAGWQAQPAAMSGETVQAVADRCAEYGMRDVAVQFHGGEPLLGGAERLAGFAGIFRETLPGARRAFGVQTNGTLLTRRNLAILQAARIGVSVSLDGDAHATRRRVGKRGEPAYDRITRGLTLLATGHRDIFGGILAVIDPGTSPAETYESLAQYNPRIIDFLLPLATWDNPPPGGCGPWLAGLFDHWQAQPRTAPPVRLFRTLMGRILGHDTRCDYIGAPPDGVTVIIQPDGTAELHDGWNVIADRATDTGMNIHDHSLAQIAAHPGYDRPEPCQACRDCRLYAECGGGYWPTRWKNGSFGWPSVYCDDLMFLIDHMAAARQAAARG